MPAQVSTDLRNTILQRQREGATISLIAKELGISRPTVYKTLAVIDNWEAWVKDKSHNITRLAYNCVERGLERGDSKLGLDWLKTTVFSQPAGDKYTIHADQVLMAGHSLLPSAANASANPVRPQLPDSIEVASVAAASTPTEAPTKAPPGDISLSCDTQFLENTDSSELIRVLESRGFRVAAPTPSASVGGIPSTCGNSEAAALPAPDSLPAQAERGVAEVRPAGPPSGELHAQ
jgi:Helix-turn-helix domain of resolvase